MAEALLGAIENVLGDAATDKVLDAWGKGYWFLADILIAREQTIYGELSAAPGGWNGWREFVVDSTNQESGINRSFRLVAADGSQVVRHRPADISPAP